LTADVWSIDGGQLTQPETKRKVKELYKEQYQKYIAV
jgi:hypothetical protein